MKTLPLQNKLQQAMLMKLMFITLFILQFFTSNLYALSPSQWDFNIKNPRNEQHFERNSGGVLIKAVPNKKQYIRNMELYINDRFISRKTQHPFAWRELHTAPRGTYNIRIKTIDTDGKVHEKSKNIYIIYNKYSAIPFKIKVKTDNQGTSNNKQFEIPMITGNEHSYRVDCDSDGQLEGEGIRGNYTCTYPRSGTYTVSIYSEHPRIAFNNEKDKNKLVSIEQWGIGEWRSMKNAFYGCSNLSSNATSLPYLGKVKSMKNMFRSTAYNNNFIKHWNVDNVTDMSGMFKDTPSFNQEIGNWVVGNVTDMSGMFGYSFNRDLFDFRSNFNQDISNWDVHNVTRINEMFLGSKSFNQDISHWDVRNVIDMKSMFAESRSFNQNINNWNVRNVRNMSNMFRDAINFNQDLYWDTRNVTDMSYMFNRATNFNRNIRYWNTSKVTDMSYMFSGATHFNQDINYWDVSNVTDMSLMFHRSLKFDQDISNWDVSKVVKMNGVFT